MEMVRSKETGVIDVNAESKVGRLIKTFRFVPLFYLKRLQAMLERKLQMKSEALMLLSQEMNQCRIERDQFKLMAEQIQERFLHLKKQMCDMKELNRYLIHALQYDGIASRLSFMIFLLVYAINIFVFVTV